MRKILYFLGAVVLALVLFVLHVLSSTGFFRTIENSYQGELLQKVQLPGAEDLTIAHEGQFLLVSSTDRAAYRDEGKKEGGLYWIDLNDNTYTPKLISDHLDFPFLPHGLSIFHLDSTTYKVFAINHARDSHSIEVFTLYRDSLVFEEVVMNEEFLISPNDLVASGPNSFYYSNDHSNTEGFKRFAEDYLGYAAANVGYYDGSDFKIVADGIAYANGINIDFERNLLYVAASRSFLVHVFDILDNADLKEVESIDCGTGVDNIELDPDGNLWIGCHPSLMTFASYAQGKLEFAPSEIIELKYTDTGDYEVNSLYVNDGTEMSACSVASPYQDRIFVGNVMDNHFLVLKQP